MSAAGVCRALVSFCASGVRSLAAPARAMAVVGVVLLSCGAAVAQIVTWGSSGSSDFGSSANWGNVAVGNTTIGSFSVGGLTSPVINSDTTISGLTFSNSSYTLTATNGAKLTVLGNGIVVTGDSAVTISAPLIFATNGTSITGSGGSLLISGAVTNNTTGLTLNGSGSDNQISGAIGGTGGLIKDGSGTWTLSGANTYAGSTLVENGTLVFDGSGLLPDGTNVSIVPNSNSGTATLQLNNVNASIGSLALGGAQCSTATLMMNGEAALTINGGVTFDATNNPKGATIDGGRLRLSGSQTFNVGSSSKSNGADLTITSAIIAAGETSPELVKSGAGVLRFQGTFGGTVTLNAGTFDVVDATLDANVANHATLSLHQSSSETSGSIVNGVISGDGQVIVGGFAQLSSNNDYSGGTVISEGGTLVAANGLGGSATGTGSITIESGGELALGDSELSGSVTGNIANSGTITVNAHGETPSQYDGVISGTGVLNKDGSGTLILSGRNTYSGDTTITRGTLQDAADGAFSPNSSVNIFDGKLDVKHNEIIGGLADGATGGDFIPSRSVCIGSDGTLKITADGEFSGSITGGGGLTIGSGASQIFTGDVSLTGVTTIQSDGTLQIGNYTTTGSVSGPIVNDGKLAFAFRADATTTAGQISGSGEVLVDGAGALFGGGNVTLANTSSYSGATVVDNSGTLADGNDYAFSPNSTLYLGDGSIQVNHLEKVRGLSDYSSASGASVTIADTAKLTITGNAVENGDGPFSRLVTGEGVLAIDSGARITLSGTVSPQSTEIASDGTLQIGDGGEAGTLSGTISNDGLLVFNRSDASTFSGIVTGSGEFHVEQGELTVTGANNATGGTFIDGKLIAANATDSATGSANVTVHSGGVLQFGDGSTVNGRVDSDIVNDGCVIFNVLAATTVDYSGKICGSGDITVKGGTTQLSGTNTFSGATKIVSGTLTDSAAGGNLSQHSAITISDGASLVIKNDETIKSFDNSAGSVTITAGALTVKSDSNFAGTIGGAGTLKIGDGTCSPLFILTGTTSESTGVTIQSNATLQIGNATTTGSVAGSIVDNGTLEVRRSDSIAVSAVSGTGSLVQSGSGTVTLSGSNSYSGLTQINGGTLTDGADSGFSTSSAVSISAGSFTVAHSEEIGGLIDGDLSGGRSRTVTIESGALLYITNRGLGDGRSLYSGDISGGGTLVIGNDGSGATQILTGTTTLAGGVRLESSSQLIIGDGGSSGALVANVDNQGATLIFNRSGSSTYNGVISNGGAVQIEQGSVTFTGANTYSGDTTIDGTLIAANASGSATGTGNVLVNYGGTLKIGDGATNGRITGDIANDGSVEVKIVGESVGTYGGQLSGSGNFTLKGGTLQLTGGSANTYTGPTIIEAGVLTDSANGGNLSSSSAIVLSSGNLTIVGNETIGGLADGTITGPRSVTIASGKKLRIGNDGLSGTPLGQSEFSGDITGDGALAIVAHATHVITGTATPGAGTTIECEANLIIGNGGTTGSLTGSVANDGQLTFNRSDESTFAGSISGKGSLYIQSGNVILSGASTYEGDTTIDGKLIVTNDAATGAGDVVVNSGHILQIGDGGSAGAISGAIVNYGNVTINRTGSLTLGGITGTGVLSQVANANLILSGSNTYSGATTLFQGLLSDANAQAFSPYSAISFGTDVAAIDVNFDESIPGISATNSGDTVNIASDATLTIANDAARSFAGAFTGSGGSLIFSGNDSKFRLTGASTFTGNISINLGGRVSAGNNNAFGSAANPITLNGGKLGVEAGVTLSNPITLTAGRLGGSGTFAAPASSAGYTIGTNVTVNPSQGGGPATLTFDGSLLSTSVLILSGGGTYKWGLANVTAANGGWDKIAVNGTVDITATAVAPFTFKIGTIDSSGNSAAALNFDPTQSYSWTVLSATSITGFTGANQFLVDSSAFTNFNYGVFSVGLSGDSTALTVNFTPVPEPSTYALLLGGLGVLAWAKRRRR